MIFLQVDNEYRRWIKTSHEEKIEVLFLQEREKIIHLAENSEKLPSEASELLTGFYFSCILFRYLFLCGLKKTFRSRSKYCCASSVELSCAPKKNSWKTPTQ